MERATVTQLWRYPVKSMMGERLDATEIGMRGVAGDRGWATRDEVRGGIRGAKKIGALMQLAARYVTEPEVDGAVPDAHITLPDGVEVRTDALDVSDRVSAAIEHPVTLWPLQPPENLDHYRRGRPDHDDVLAELRDMFGRDTDADLPDLSGFPSELFEFESPPDTYFDAFPLLLLTEESLKSFAEAAPQSIVDVRRFRPNVVIATSAAEPFPEQAWIGSRLRIGDAVVEVTTSCPRCVMITRPFAELPQDRSLVKTVVSVANHDLGVYARVVAPGRVTVGATVAPV